MSRLARTNISDDDYLDISKKIDNCWREKAREANVKGIGDRGYTLVIDNSMTKYGEYDSDTRTVKISITEIINGAFRREANVYMVGTYAHVHEATHDDRHMGNRALLGEGNKNEEERLTQEEAYHRFKNTYDEVEPPYSFRTEEEVEQIIEYWGDNTSMLNLTLQSLKWNDNYVKGSKGNFYQHDFLTMAESV